MMIETDRMELHSPSFKFAKRVLRFYEKNREHLKTWEPARSQAFYTLEYQIQDLVDQTKAFRKGEEYRFWLMEKTSPHEIIGSVVLSGIMRGNYKSCFMGYKMDVDHTGQGLITEACNKVLAFAFDEDGVDMHRVEINVVPNNHASIRVAHKLGFVEEGFSKAYLNIDSQWKDHLRFAKTREE